MTEMPQFPPPNKSFGDLTNQELTDWWTADLAGYLAASRAYHHPLAEREVEAEISRSLAEDWAKIRRAILRIVWPFGRSRG